MDGWKCFVIAKPFYFLFHVSYNNVAFVYYLIVFIYMFPSFNGDIVVNFGIYLTLNKIIANKS